jgi:hypothetical protein
MPDRIRFTLVEDGQDVRPYDFDTETVQIGADPGRGDNLLIDLPPRLRHVRAKIFRQAEYVEMEVKSGPVWVQGSRLEEGDVVELNIGDMLIFGTKKPRGVRLRYETAKEADIVLDDVADWTVAAQPKKGRAGATAEDEFTFEEEKSPTEGMNPYQKARYHWRQQYKKLTKFRKKAARISYWVSLVKLGWQKIGKFLLIGGGFLALGLGFMNERSQKTEAVEDQAVAEEREELAARGEQDAISARTEMEGQMRECGCAGASGPDQGALATADGLWTYFGEEDEAFAPQRDYPMPNKTMVSLSSLINVPRVAVSRNKSLLNPTVDRVCSAMKEKDKMRKVQLELAKYGLHEAYAFLPFVESLWCELAVSFTGPRGMMQFTRATAESAFRQVDPTQADIPSYDFNTHNQWLLNKSGKYGGYYRMLAACPATVRADYIREFYDGRSNPEYPNRLDPNDPRTDWEISTEAAFSWLQHLDGYYRGKGYKGLDAIMMAMAAYNQGQGTVQRWVTAALALYGVENEGALSYVHVHGGALKALEAETDGEMRRRFKEGMSYAPKIVAYYLVAAPKLDALKCRE